MQEHGKTRKIAKILKLPKAADSWGLHLGFRV